MSENKLIVSILLSCSFYLTLPIFNYISILFFNDEWLINKFSIVLLFITFVLALLNHEDSKQYIKSVMLSGILLSLIILHSILISGFYGFELNMKVNNLHIFAFQVLFLIYIFKLTDFDAESLIIKPLTVISSLIALVYIFKPSTIHHLYGLISDSIGVHAILIDRVGRFSSIFSEPSQFSIFCGFALFYFFGKKSYHYSFASLVLLILSASKFTILILPICFFLGFISKSLTVRQNVTVIFGVLLIYFSSLVFYESGFKLLYEYVPHYALNTFETRFGFLILAGINLFDYPFGVGIFNGFQNILLDGSFSISDYCHNLLLYGGNCYELMSYSYNSGSEFSSKDFTSQMIFYFGVFGLILTFALFCSIIAIGQKHNNFYLAYYLVFALLLVTSLNYIVVFLLLIMLYQNNNALSKES